MTTIDRTEIMPIYLLETTTRKNLLLMTEQFYDAHLFCCVNQRDPDHPRGSCAARGSEDLHQYMKDQAKELEIKGIRVNKSGCLDRCELGPVMVIYPEGIWYGINSTEDIDQILRRHILNGVPVDHLILDNDQEFPELNSDNDLNLKVSRVENLTDTVKLFELRCPNNSRLPVFSAGAHIDVKISDDIRRSYSLTNDPAERDRYVISVLYEPDGRGGSRQLHNTLAVGTSVTVVPPVNNFDLIESASEHLFIAGGIGISPILSMGRHLKGQGSPTTLHYCTRSPEQTAFKDEVEQAFGDGLTFHHDGGVPSNGIDLHAVLQTRPEGAHLYICGPKGLIDAAQAAASHWPDDCVHYELFAGSEEANQTDDGVFTVILKKSGLELEIPPGKSILEVVHAAGVEADSACESGVCGTCQTELLEGVADHRDDFLSPAEQDRQETIMICASRAKAGETLVLDL